MEINSQAGRFLCLVPVLSTQSPEREANSMTIVTAVRTPPKGEAAVPSLRVADHTVSSVQVSTRDSLKGGGCSKKASKYPFIFVTARVNFSSCVQGGGGVRGQVDRQFHGLQGGASPEV